MDRKRKKIIGSKEENEIKREKFEKRERYGERKK